MMSNQFPSLAYLEGLLPPLDLSADCSESIDNLALNFGQSIYPTLCPPPAAISPTVPCLAHDGTSSEDFHNGFSMHTTIFPQRKCDPAIPCHEYLPPAPRSCLLDVQQPRIDLERVPLRGYKAAPGFELLSEKQPICFVVKGEGFLWLGSAEGEFERQCSKMIGGGMKIQEWCGGQKASLRICWPEPITGRAYPEFKRQIIIRRSNKGADPISCTKLAIIIRKQLASFIESNKNIPYGDPEWKVGSGGIELEDLYLVAVHIVSRGSIQPVLWVKR